VLVLMNSAHILLTPALHSNSDHMVLVTINDKSVRLTHGFATPVYQEGELLAHLYEMPDGAVQVTLPNNSLVVVYDGVRVMLQASNEYRNQIRGLCGNMDGEPFNDFKTPNNCLIQEPFIFAATYAIDEESCQRPAKIKEQIKKHACMEEAMYRANVIPNALPKSARL